MKDLLTRIISANPSNESFSIHPQGKSLDFERLYRQYKRVFMECAYMNNRHHVKITLAIFKFSDTFEIPSVKMQSLLRLTDKHISFDQTYHTIIFTFTDAPMAYNAVLRIAKVLMQQFHTDINEICTCVIAQKTDKVDIFTVLKQTCLAVEALEKGGIHLIDI